jgi:hypothetical protein
LLARNADASNSLEAIRKINATVNEDLNQKMMICQFSIMHEAT